MSKFFLNIQKLTAGLIKQVILNNVTLTVQKNESHIILGPNGSGKSTLLKVITGHPHYKIYRGLLFFNKENLSKLDIVTRAQRGIFLAFQTPLEIYGLSNYEFLRLIYNKHQKYLKKEEIDPLNFLFIVQPFLNLLKLSSNFLIRNVNQSFSGGEKKQNEILQLVLLKPCLILLDELDAGLDFTVLQRIFKILFFKLKEYFIDSSFIIITHNSKIFNYVQVSKLYILLKGSLYLSGKIELLYLIEKFGYPQDF